MYTMRSSIEVAKYIERLLEQKKMTAAELARRTGMNRSTMTRYFKGDRKIPMDEIPKFAKALDLEPEELLIQNISSDITNSLTLDYDKKLKLIMSENIQHQLDKRGISQTDMARDLNIPEMTVSNWMKAKTYPRIDKIQLMADYFNIWRSDLTEKRHSSEYEIESDLYTYRYKPVKISAGVPITIDGIEEDDFETITLPDELMGKWARNDDIYFVKANGDSMNKIFPDDSLLGVKTIHNVNELKDNDIVIFNYDNEYSVKRFKIDEERNKIIFRPESFDETFTDLVIEGEQIAFLEIVGRVVVYVVNQ